MSFSLYYPAWYQGLCFSTMTFDVTPQKNHFSKVSPEGVLEEARYFGFESLLPRLEQLVAHESLPRY